MTITTRAAVFTEVGEPWTVKEIELDEPRGSEVLVRMEVAGLCHSDEHNTTGDFPVPAPAVGGHEGAGIVEAIGDSVFVSATPACGRCKYCQGGRGHLCDENAHVLAGVRADGTAKYHSDGVDIGAYAQIGTFSQYVTAEEYSVVKYDREKLSPEIAALVSCGGITGWGAVVNVAEVRSGDVVVCFGTGGVGMNSVQAAHNAGALAVIAIDPQPFKREMALKLGADHSFATVGEARDTVFALTDGQGADHVILTPGVLKAEHMVECNEILGKGGHLVTTAVARFDEENLPIPISSFSLAAKQWRGVVFGNANRKDTHDLVRLAESGAMKYHEMITREYTLDQINEGYRDMYDGKNIRGIIRF